MKLPISGWYDSSLDDYISAGDYTGGCKHIDWIVKNRLKSVDGYCSVTLYISVSLLSKSITPKLFEYAYLKGIAFGVAYSHESEVDGVIKYNAGKNVYQKLHFMVSELEPDNTGDYATFERVIKYAYSKLKQINVPNIIYLGRLCSHYNVGQDAKWWDIVVRNSNSTMLHCYRPAKYMTGAAMWDYLDNRELWLAKSFKNTLSAGTVKKYPVSTIFSCEPDSDHSCYTWFLTHSWDEPMKLLTAYSLLHDPEIVKTYLQKNSSYIFKTKYGKQIRPGV